MIGLLELRRRKLQFGLIALVVTLVSYLVLMINGLGVGLNIQAGSVLRNFNADGIAYSDNAGLSVIRSELSSEAVTAIADADGGDRTAPLGYVAANYRRTSGVVKSAAFLGFVPGTIGEPDLVKGRILAADDERALLADSRFLAVADLEVGDTVSVTVRLVTEEFVIVGEIDEGAFFFQPAVYVLLSTWQRLRYGESGDGQPAASIVLVKGGDLVPGEGPGYKIVGKGTAFNNIEGVQGQQSTVQALRVFGFVIGGLVIAVFFYVITLQKVTQIGILKAVGASSMFVFRQLVIQVLFVTSVAVAVSVLLAWATALALRQLPDGVPIAFTTQTYVLTVAGLFVVGLLATLISGRQVLKVDPIIALGQQQ
ncbi:MAG TPA: ABC transporter permease [Dehalococcoidia bacterium]|nr:ABC transporter permease [Dehalococcoidia bacterium]